ncbi:hypothetical protein EU853_23210, partial [Salmonella enterica subsp. enterica serovar Stanleyville]|nr:hypothetical protein [Salmonella enterica subsp. enterica serovar Stanleyville]ECB1586214.1 hypothetical protein [Salmonella enterica subsp. enterica serovar Stanleyville]
RLNKVKSISFFTYESSVSRNSINAVKTINRYTNLCSGIAPITGRMSRVDKNWTDLADNSNLPPSNGDEVSGTG